MNTDKIKAVTVDILMAFATHDFTIDEVFSTIVSLVVNMANNEDKEHIKTVFDVYTTGLDAAKKRLLQAQYNENFIFAFPVTDEILANTVKGIMKGGK